MSLASILIGCEVSETVRTACIKRGYDAWPCDLLSAEFCSNRHIPGDVREVLDDGWDMLTVAQLVVQLRGALADHSARQDA